MIGASVNGVAIIIGSVLGLLLSRGIRENTKETIMQGMSLAVMAIGMSGAIAAENFLVVIGSLGIGGWLGEMIDLHAWLENLGHKMDARFSKKEGSGIAKGFVTGTVIYCSGAMAIVGAMESGLNNNHTTLFTKSVIDGITAILFTSTFGIGVAFSAIPVFLYEGAIALMSVVVRDFLSEAMIADMSAVGGLLILAIGLNILGVVKIRVANMLPAVFTPIALYAVMNLF